MITYFRFFSAIARLEVEAYKSILLFENKQNTVKEKIIFILAVLKIQERNFCWITVGLMRHLWLELAINSFLKDVWADVGVHVVDMVLQAVQEVVPVIAVSLGQFFLLSLDGISS